MGIIKSCPATAGLVLAAIACGADAPKDNAAKEDVKKLQGTWQVTEWVDASEKPAPADEIKEYTFEFKGDRVTLRKTKDDGATVFEFKLDASKQPKWIDLTFADAMLGTLGGIYKIDGEELTICVIDKPGKDKPGPRPTEFKASKARNAGVFVLKKVKK